MNKEFLKKIDQVLSQTFDGKSLNDLGETKLSDLDIDSMDFVDMIFDIEEALGITIGNEDIDSNLSLNKFIQTLTDQAAG